MSFPPAPEDAPPPKPTLPGINPYAAPEAELTEAPAAADDDLTRAEVTRQKYLNHEASIRFVGTLHLLGAIVGVLGMIGITTMLVSSRPQAGGPGVRGATIAIVAMMVYFAVITVLSIALGMGLRNLRPWARLVDAGLIILSMVLNLASIGLSSMGGANQLGQAVAIFFASALIPGYILYLLVSEKGRVVFSPEYKEVIARTPHIKYRTSCVVRVLFLLLIVIPLLGALGALLGRLLR